MNYLRVENRRYLRYLCDSEDFSFCRKYNVYTYGLYRAVCNEEVEVIKYLCSTGVRYKIDKCVLRDNLYLARCLVEHNSDGFVQNIVRYCNLRILKFLISCGFPYTGYTINAAAASGKSDCITYLLSFMCPNDGLLELSTRYGHMKTTKMLIEMGLNYTSYIHTHLIKNGKLDMIRYFISLGYYHSIYFVDILYSKNVNVIKYMTVIESYDINDTLLRHSINIKRIEIIKYLVSIGCKYKQEHVDLAISNKSFDIADEIYIDNSVCSDRILRLAHDNIDIFDYLVNKDVGYSTLVLEHFLHHDIYHLFSHKYTKLIEHINANGIEYDKEYIDILSIE